MATEKKLSHDEAANRGNYCPLCGLISHDANPQIYNCPRCGNEGFECCFPAGRATVCISCEEGESNAN